MIDWVFMAVPFYVAYRTVLFATIVWKKENNKFASIVIILLAACIVGLAILLKIK